MKTRLAPASAYSRSHYNASAAVLFAAFIGAGLAHAQPTWTGATDNVLNTVSNWSPAISITSGTTTNTNGVVFGATAPTTTLSLTADLQFAGGSSPTSNAMLFNGAGFTLTGNTGTRQLTIGGQGLAINTTNTITIDVPRIRRNASNTFEFLGSGGNLVINGEYSTNIAVSPSTADALTRVDFTGSGGNNNTITFNGAIVNLFTGTVGSGLGNFTTSSVGTGNRVIFNNATNTGITGIVTVGAGSEVHLGDGGTKGTIAGNSSILNNGRFVINQSDAVFQGVEFAAAALAGSGTFVQAGAGTTTLTAANTFSGGVIVSGGTLTVSASERINNVNRLTLSGGNFDVGSFSETLGVLDLEGAGGTLSVGTGGALVFADSSAEVWSGTLTVSGSFISGSSLRFGTTGSGLNSGQLGAISISGFTGFGLNSSGFLTASAIPEPSSFAVLAGLGALGFCASRRRRAA